MYLHIWKDITVQAKQRRSEFGTKKAIFTVYVWSTKNKTERGPKYIRIHNLDTLSLWNDACMPLNGRIYESATKISEFMKLRTKGLWPILLPSKRGKAPVDFYRIVSVSHTRRRTNYSLLDLSRISKMTSCKNCWLRASRSFVIFMWNYLIIRAVLCTHKQIYKCQPWEFYQRAMISY